MSTTSIPSLPAQAKQVTRSPGSAELNYRSHMRRDSRTRIALGIALPVIILVLWEVSSTSGWVDERFFSSPSQIWERMLVLIESGRLQEATLITGRRLILGFTLGSLAGILLGLLLSQSTRIKWLVEPTLRGLYVIPKLALLPVLLLIFGLGEMPKLVFVSLGVFYIMAFTTLSSAAMVPHSYYEVSSTFGLSWMQKFRWVVVPGALPGIVAGLRLASGYGVLLVIAMEFVASDDGLGYLTWHSWELFIADQMYVGIVAVAVLGVTFSAIVGAIGRRLCPWAALDEPVPS